MCDALNDLRISEIKACRVFRDDWQNADQNQLVVVTAIHNDDRFNADRHAWFSNCVPMSQAERVLWTRSWHGGPYAAWAYPVSSAEEGLAFVEHIRDAEAEADLEECRDLVATNRLCMQAMYQMNPYDNLLYTDVPDNDDSYEDDSYEDDLYEKELIEKEFREAALYSKELYDEELQAIEDSYNSDSDIEDSDIEDYENAQTAGLIKNGLFQARALFSLAIRKAKIGIRTGFRFFVS